MLSAHDDVVGAPYAGACTHQQTDSPLFAVSASHVLRGACPLLLARFHRLLHFCGGGGKSFPHPGIEENGWGKGCALTGLSIPRVGMVRHPVGNSRLDIGMEPVSLVCQISAPHFHPPLDSLYYHHECPHIPSNWPLHGMRPSWLFSPALSRERCLLVVL